LANSRQATKRARQADKRRQHNMSQRSTMRTYIKQVIKAVTEGQLENAKTLFTQASSKLDRLAQKGLIHKNKAARLKSRLNSLIFKAAA